MTRQPALPSYHLRPRRGWLNDPNGMAYVDGRWHVFYQHNPAAAVHGDIHWGHASSDDLVTWREHPVAFGPQPEGPDRAGCWSGVLVQDETGTFVAYSGVVDSSAVSTTVLRRALGAGPQDRLDTWSDPWTVATTPPADGPDGVAVMRDPFLFTFGGRRWALHGAGLSDGTGAVLLYDAQDLDAWRYVGPWFRGRDAADIVGSWAADIYECPQLALVDGRAVLVVSTQLERRLDDVIAIVGDLAENPDRPGQPTFTAVAAQRLDAGEVCYAPQFALDPDGPWHLGWARQEDVRADDTAPDEDLVAGCLTLPRRIRVVGDRIVVTRDPATEALLADESEELDAGEHELPAASMTLTHGGALISPEGEIPLPDCPVEVWLDGEVVEVYPAEAPGDGAGGGIAGVGGPGVPATYRHVDTVAWRLRVPSGATARLRRVRVPARG